MRTLLTNITHLATFEDGAGPAGREICDAYLLLEGTGIAALGPMSELGEVEADRTIDLSGHVVMPGLVNTHHHMYQNLTRLMVQDETLFTWLTTLYPIWANIDDAAIAVASQMAMAELLASGCTTTSDHLYILPNDVTLDTSIRVAKDMGIRFHATRGAMSRGKSQGGLPPDAVCEDEAAILADSERLIGAYHDMSDHAMTRIALAPCSPFSVTAGLMKEAAELARAHKGVHLHSHIAEVLDEEVYCQEIYGMRSVGFVESVGWLGEDVWFAHAIFLNDDEIRLFAETGTGSTYCPSAHMRCGSGIMRAREMLDAGCTIAFGVDGSASNDTSDMFGEVRLGMMLQRVAPAQYLSATPGGRGGFGGTAAALSAREALWMATRGGAKVLGRSDIGRLTPGAAADVIAVDLNRFTMAGAQRDPLASVVFLGPQPVSYSFVNGVPLIEKGAFVSFDVDGAMHAHRATVQRIFEG